MFYFFHIFHHDLFCYIFSHQDDIYCCGSEECEKALINKDPFSAWTMAVETTIIKLTEARCDFCFLFAPLEEVHRSLCKTKNYCSKECRREDEQAHKVCCKEGSVDKRKLKMGGKEKVLAASQRLDGVSKVVGGSPMLRQVLSDVKAEKSKKPKGAKKGGKTAVKDDGEVD